LGTQVSDLIAKTPEFQGTLEQVQRMRASLGAGATTGGLSELKLKLAQGVNGVMGADVFKTASSELAKTTFADMALTASARMQRQGQITENERKMLASTVASMGNSPEAANYIANYMEAGAKRSLAKAQALQELRDSGNTAGKEYSRILTTWEKDHPIDLKAANAVPNAKGGAATNYAAMTPEQRAARRAELEKRNAELRGQLGTK
jgi:hypothetical protein